MLETLMINTAYVALIAGSQRKDMVSLRILMMAAAVAFIVYGALRGIWPMVAWNLVIGGNHLRLLAGQFRRSEPEPEPKPAVGPVRLEAVPLESLPPAAPTRLRTVPLASVPTHRASDEYRRMVITGASGSHDRVGPRPTPSKVPTPAVA